MTDQFTYLNHRMQHLESRVKMLERVVRPESGGSEEPLGAPSKRRQEVQVTPDDDQRMIQAVLWSIYEFVTNQSIGHTNDYKDIVEIKHSQVSGEQRLESIEQAVSEVHDGIQTIIGMLSRHS